ncbi:MAG: signal transduction histidine kinase/CheY-like chemotaxis protein [Planctomycetaceae bacterium]|jgi:signal transduction histidine kinase/CheY-like chemotaxis protein
MDPSDKPQKARLGISSYVDIRWLVLRDTCLIMSVTMLFFGANHIRIGSETLGWVSLLFSLTMLLTAYRLNRTRSDQSGGMFILICGALVILLTVYTDSYGIYWSYVELTVSFLILKRRSAIKFNIVFIPLIIMASVDTIGAETGVRVGGTLMLLAVLSYVFTIRAADRDRKRVSYAIEVRKANTAKSDFIANMSHEMRTPLTVIMGHAENLSDGTHPNSASEGYLAAIVSNAKALSLMIDDVMDLARLEGSNMAASKSRLEVAPFIVELGRDWQFSVENSGVQFIINVNRPVPRYLHTDGVKLKQILSKLISNAAKFTDSGSIELSVEYLSDSCKLAFSVIDTGFGVAPEFRDRLFEKFTQADTSMTRNQGGVGLGLYISKSLAQLLDADLSYKPLVEGSEFRLSLQLDSIPEEWTDENASWEISASPEVLLPKQFVGRVLIVEDSVAITFLIELLLGKMGVNCKAVDNGLSAVEILRVESFALVLMDLQMPIMSGIDATKAIKQFDSDTPIVALSADVLLYDKGSSQFEEFDGLLAKPVEMAQLQGILEKYLPLADAVNVAQENSV